MTTPPAPSVDSLSDDWCLKNNCSEYAGECVRGTAFKAGYTAAQSEITALKAENERLNKYLDGERSQFILHMNNVDNCLGKLHDGVYSLRSQVTTLKAELAEARKQGRSDVLKLILSQNACKFVDTAVYSQSEF